MNTIPTAEADYIRLLVTSRYALQKARIQTQLRILALTERLVALTSNELRLTNNYVDQLLAKRDTKPSLDETQKVHKFIETKLLSPDVLTKRITKKNGPAKIVLTDSELTEAEADATYAFVDGLISTRLGQVTPEKIRDLHKFMDTTLQNAEDNLENLIDNEMKPLKSNGSIVEWMTDQIGIGTVIAAGLVSGIQDIGRFDTPSKLWAFSGLDVIQRCRKCDKRYFSDPFRKQQFIKKIETFNRKADNAAKKDSSRVRHVNSDNMICSCAEPAPYSTAPRRKHGEISTWSPFMRTLSWRIGDSFNKFRNHPNSTYGALLASTHKQCLEEHARKCGCKTEKGHSLAMAKRKVEKIFLCNLWEHWRRLEGLPIRPPYVHEKLNHTTLLPSQDSLKKNDSLNTE